MHEFIIPLRKFSFLIFLLNAQAFGNTDCRLYTLKQDEILRRSSEIYKKTIKVSNLRTLLNKFGKKVYGTKAREKLLVRLRKLNSKQGMTPVYYVKDPELTSTQIELFVKRFSKSEEKLKELDEAAHKILIKTPETVDSWIKSYSNYNKNMDSLIERVISLESQIEDLDKLKTFNKRVELHEIKNGEVFVDVKNSQFIDNEGTRDILVKTIKNEIRNITGNSTLGFQMGNILKLDHRQAVLQKQLLLLETELAKIVHSPYQKYNEKELVSIHNEIIELLANKELLPTESAKAQLRLHETYKEFVDFAVPSFLKKKAMTYDAKLARLEELKKASALGDSPYEVLVAGIDRFGVFYRRYGVFVIAATTFTGLTLPAFTAFKVTSYFQSDATRKRICIDILNPHDESFNSNPNEREELFEDCYFRYLRKKLGDDFVNALENNSKVTIQIKRDDKVSFETKEVSAIKQHEKYSKFLEIQKEFREALKKESEDWKVKESIHNQQINIIDPDNIRDGFPLND